MKYFLQGTADQKLFYKKSLFSHSCGLMTLSGSAFWHLAGVFFFFYLKGYFFTNKKYNILRNWLNV
jgi:hypothetical protein